MAAPQTVFLTIGLPASGKTTWAREYLNIHYSTIRINNDDIRAELKAHNPTEWTPKFEKQVRKIRIERLEKALKSGYDVILDNTYLNPHTLKSLKTWIVQNYPSVKIIEKDFRDVPVQTCIDRDKEREHRGERFVGPEVILKMATEAGLIPEVKLYPVDWELPWTIICDLDGTLALFGKRRNAYDASLCDLTDEPNLPVLQLLMTYRDCYIHDKIMGYNKEEKEKIPACRSLSIPLISKIYFFSGRTDNYRLPTLRFLLNKCGFCDVDNDPYFKLVMRETGDNRSDEVVKKEFFDEHIKGKYNVFVVIDDRPKVIRMWHSLGLPVFNVGDGHEF
jgi:predicted kinase